jgi:hypothetical protein
MKLYTRLCEVIDILHRNRSIRLSLQHTHTEISVGSERETFTVRSSYALVAYITYLYLSSITGIVKFSHPLLTFIKNLHIHFILKGVRIKLSSH